MKAAANNCVKISRIRSIFSPYLTVLNFEVYGLNLQLAKIRENAKQKITLNIEIHAKKLEPSIVNKMLLLLLFYQLKAVSRYCKQSLHSMLLHFSYVRMINQLYHLVKRCTLKNAKWKSFLKQIQQCFYIFLNSYLLDFISLSMSINFHLKKKKTKEDLFF